MGHLFGIVDTASDEWSVRIAFHEIDNHLLSDSGQSEEPPFLSGHVLGRSDPARAVLVPLTFAVPIELDLDSPKLIAEDLFPLRSDDHRGLDA